MAETIRDVLIRVSVESGQSNLKLPELSLAQRGLEDYQHSIQNVSQSWSSLVDAQQTGLSTITSTGGSTSLASSGNIQTAINEARAELAAAKNALKGGPTLQSPEEKADFASKISELREASTATDDVGESFLSANVSANTLLMGVSALGAGLKAYSIIQNELRDTNQRYWDEMADDASTAFARGANRISRQGENDAQMRGVFATDISSTQSAAARIAAQENRERQIQREQNAMAERPLSDRQEVRSRIESQGANSDQMEQSRLRLEQLQKSNELLEINRSEIEDRLEMARKNHTGTVANIEKSRGNVKATRAGNLQGDWNRFFGDGTLGEANEGSYNFLGQMWDHSVAGETTLWDEHLHNKETKTKVDESTSVLREAEKSEAMQLANIEKERLLTSQSISKEAEKQLGLIVNEQREARIAAEVGQEALKNKEIRFGMTDEATKASLRQIQHLADTGVPLNHQQSQLALGFGIRAGDQAKKQALASAHDPANDSLFAHDRELQKQREQRMEAANSDPVNSLKTELSQIVEKQSGDIQGIKEDAIKAVEHGGEVIEILHSLLDGLKQQRVDMQRLLAKSRGLFG